MGCINALIVYTVVIAPVWGDKNIDEVLMRKVIRHVAYDTNNSKRLAEASIPVKYHGCVMDQAGGHDELVGARIVETLFKTKGGKYFVHTQDDQSSLDFEVEDITPLTPSQVRAWRAKH